MNFLQGVIRFLDAVSEYSGRAVSWLTAAMVAVVCFDVVTRYFLKSSSVAVAELEWHLFAIIFLLGAAYTLKHDRHVRVDVLYTRFSPKQKAWVDLLGCLIFLIPFCLLVFWFSQTFVSNAFTIRETSPDPGGLPARYILKACIPLGFFLVFLQGLSGALKSIHTIRTGGAATQEATQNV